MLVAESILFGLKTTETQAVTLGSDWYRIFGADDDTDIWEQENFDIWYQLISWYYINIPYTTLAVCGYGGRISYILETLFQTSLHWTVNLTYSYWRAYYIPATGQHQLIISANQHIGRALIVTAQIAILVQKIAFTLLVGKIWKYCSVFLTHKNTFYASLSRLHSDSCLP